MILQTFVPSLGIGDINTIVANSEYDNDQLTWNVVVPPSVLKQHQAKASNTGVPPPKYNQKNQQSPPKVIKPEMI